VLSSVASVTWGSTAPGVQVGSGRTPFAACRAWQLPAAGKGWTALCGGSVASRPPGSEAEVDAGAVAVADAPVAVVVAVIVVVGVGVVSTGEPVAPHPTASNAKAASTAVRRVRTQVRAQPWFIGSLPVQDQPTDLPVQADQLGVHRPRRLHPRRPDPNLDLLEEFGVAIWCC